MRPPNKLAQNDSAACSHRRPHPAWLLLFVFNGLWIYAVWDRAKSNGRDNLPREYEIPRYYVRKLDGTLDYDAKWPGWDGWYFFAIPDARDIPLRMVRASLMTGLYGLEGIDNYERLQLKLFRHWKRPKCCP